MEAWSVREVIVVEVMVAVVERNGTHPDDVFQGQT